MAALLASLGLAEAGREGEEGGDGDGSAAILADEVVSKPDLVRTDTSSSALLLSSAAEPSEPTGMRDYYSGHPGRGETHFLDIHLRPHCHLQHEHAKPLDASHTADMSVSHSLVWKRPAAQTAPDDGEFRRKKLKLNDLPVSSAKRTAIDSLLLTFKKSGEFDKFRKGIFSQFESSVCCASCSFLRLSMID